MNDKNSIRKARQRLLDEMAKVDPTSEQYDKLSSQLEKLTKSEQNDKGWKTQLGLGFLQTAISSISSFSTVYAVLRHEDKGNIVTTKSLNYAEKPRVGQLHYDKSPDTKEKSKYIGNLIIKDEKKG